MYHNRIISLNDSDFRGTVHLFPLCTSFLQAGDFSCCPMQNFYIAKHSTGLLVVPTECNTEMVKTCEKWHQKVSFRDKIPRFLHREMLRDLQVDRLHVA